MAYEETKAVARELTLAEKVSQLADDLFATNQDLRALRDDVESHHIRINRVENETGLLPRESAR